MKNRTIIGIICIVLALVVTFAVAPLVNKLADNRTDIVRLTGDVVQGHMISDTDIEVVTVGSYNLPTDVITKKEDVLGKFAAVDLKKGDYLLPSKVTSVSDSADDVFRTLDGTKQAISVPLLYVLNKDWYDALMFTLPGKIVLAVCGVVILITAVLMMKYTRPVEYKR